MWNLLLAQMAGQHQGWLTTKLLNVTLGSAEWVLWLLAILSVLSIAVMIERAVYFATHSIPNAGDLTARLVRGELEGVRQEVGARQGMEAAVIKEGVSALNKGPAAVEEIIACTVARERPKYERFLSLLGTLGNNAPFVGLFGTVLGIIKAFHDLGSMGKGASVQSTVMAGISEALVATAVGLAVAIPAVVAYNVFTRAVKNMVASTTALGHALVANLKAEPPVGASDARAVGPGTSPVREVR